MCYTFPFCFFLTPPTYLLLYDPLQTSIPIFSYCFFFFLQYIGWQMELVQIGRHTRAALGRHLRQRKGEDRKDAHMFVMILLFFLFLFCFLFAVFTPFFHFLTTSSMRVLIIFFCRLRSRPVSAGVFFTAPSPLFFVGLSWDWVSEGSVTITYRHMLLCLYWFPLQQLVFIVYYLPSPWRRIDGAVTLFLSFVLPVLFFYCYLLHMYVWNRVGFLSFFHSPLEISEFMSVYWRLLFGIFYGVLLRVYTHRWICLILLFPPLFSFFFSGGRGRECFILGVGEGLGGGGAVKYYYFSYVLEVAS